MCLQCSTLVFAKRDTCFKCKAPKPVGGVGRESGGVGGEAGGGDNCAAAIVGGVAGGGAMEDGGRLGEGTEGGGVDVGEGGGGGEWVGVRQRTRNALHAEAWK